MRMRASMHDWVSFVRVLFFSGLSFDGFVFFSSMAEKTKELEAQNNQILGFSKSGFAGLIVMMLLVVVCVCCYFVRKKREAHDRADDLEFDGGMRTKIRHEFD